MNHEKAEERGEPDSFTTSCSLCHQPVLISYVEVAGHTKKGLPILNVVRTERTPVGLQACPNSPEGEHNISPLH